MKALVRPMRFAFGLIMTLTVFTFFAGLPAGASNTPGAIFTTDSGCSGVDLNIYTSKTDVFLDGGPTHNGSANLNAGAYYVQVTDPSGATVLGTSVPLPAGSGVGNNQPFVVTVSNGVTTVPCFELFTALVKGSDNTRQGFDDTPNAGGEYKVWVSTDPNFANDSTKTDNFKVLNNGPQAAEISGVKFYDANVNGVQDPGEPVIDGWTIRLFTQDPNTLLYSFTSETSTHLIGSIDGEYLFSNLSPSSTYAVCEVIPSSSPTWINTTPKSVTGIIPSRINNFGNVCLGTVGSPVTLGFWSNKNGQNILTGSKTGTSLISAYSTLLNSTLVLRNANGSRASFSSYAALQSWLLNATAANMAYMLSAQLATMELNVATGNVSGTSIIYAPGANSANAFGFTTVTNLMNEANLALTSCTDPGTSTLASTCSVLSGNPIRSYMQGLETALDQGNNGNNFVEPTACSFSYAVGDTCAP